jgi:hypothetical protein
MAEKLSYEELLSTLNGLKVRSVLQTELGWVVGNCIGVGGGTT